VRGAAGANNPGIREARARLRDQADPERARVLQRFFKTGPGEYGEGDLFLGIPVPRTRQLAGELGGLDYEKIEKLLRSKFHEERLLALLILVRRYGREEGERKRIYRLYLGNTKWINNWDLVDTTAEHIVGEHLREEDRSRLFRLARSRSLWERRIAVMATFNFIKAGDFEDTLRLAEMLLQDREDLIHKACGWMLREIGKRDRRVLGGFLDRHGRRMPRTMLRYSIEKLPAGERKRYLEGKRQPGLKGLSPGERSWA
jgi:3-methyladenine DNA glycosylase AlkD